MFISDFAIKRPIITVVTMIALVVFGLAALARLDTDEFPAIDSPIVFVAIAYPGASPDVVEREVVSRLEDKISGISGVDKINSTSRDGFAQILVQFVFSKPVDQATQDIRDAISAVRSQLPAEILEPIIQRFDPNQLPIVSLALTSTVLSTPQLTALADPTIAGDLRSIAGVAQVNVVGGDSAQLSINVRPTDLAAFGVGIDQVVNAVRAQNLAAPVGQVNSALEQRSIRLEGRFEHPEEFNQLVVAQRGGQLITLGQVAYVEAGAAEPTSAALFSGRQAIGLDIVKSREYSTTAVAALVRARIAQLQKTLPQGTRLEVVRENIVRHVELGSDHMTASHEGTDEIGLAVAATTFSIVAVFAPVGFMPGIAGQWFKPFALTIACAVLVSLFVSFSLDPMLSAYWPDPQLEAHERRNPVARALDRFNVWFDRQADRYKGLIAWALDHRWTMVGLAALSFVLAIALQIVIGGFAFVPVSDQSELNIAIETPAGSSLDYMTLTAAEVARTVRARPEGRYTYTTVGSSTGSGEVDNGSVYVRLKPKNQRSISQDAFGQVMRKRMRLLGGATAFTYASGFGGAQKQLQLQLQGPDPTILAQLAEKIEAIVRSVPGAVDVGLSTRGQKPELNVRVNRGLAGALGVNLSQLATSLRFAFAGVDAGTWVDPSGISRYVHVRLVPEARENASDLGQLPVVVAAAAPNAVAAPNNGATSTTPPVVPLRQVATITPSFGPAQIDHYQRQRVITIGANVEGASFGNVSKQVMGRVKRLQMPAGYQVSAGGQAESQNQVFGSIFTALGIAVMLMYLILVIQFGSFLDPLAILISLPLSLIGVVLALIITRDSLNLMSLIGVILLMGIVAKNAILLIDFAKWAHKDRGLDLRAALIEAGRIRLRPILMTTLALIAGMVPVALGLGEGADFRAPLGRAVIGGVITSTILTLVVIPTVYEILDEWRVWLFARFRGSVVAHRPVPAESPGD